MTTLLLGDCIEKIKMLPDNSVDSVVTDPPYGLGFMNKEWDTFDKSQFGIKNQEGENDLKVKKNFDTLPRYKTDGLYQFVNDWATECFRVLKPGGHLLSFAGSRTYHKICMGIEDAGFEIRDQIMWVYGSGFPKSHNIGKAVDKLQGIEIEKTTETLFNNPNGKRDLSKRSDYGYKYEAQNEWEGWGTALKPAHEPIVMARKPLSEKTVVENVLRWGTGGINIDVSRIGTEQIKSPQHGKNTFNGDYEIEYNGEYKINEGRWPANIIFECTCDKTIPSQQKEVKVGKDRRAFFHEENQIFSGGTKTSQRIEDYGDTGVIHTDPNCPCYMLDQQSGISKSSVRKPDDKNSPFNPNYGWNNNSMKGTLGGGFNDKGGASRFFYCPKASKKDRDEGMDNFEEYTSGKNGRGLDRMCSECGTKMVNQKDCVCENPNWIDIPKKNYHPTVKPTDLMLYLIKLVTPKGGTVLEPFMGSGSTGKAAVRGGYDFIGIEKEEEYLNIAKARIENELK